MCTSYATNLITEQLKLAAKVGYAISAEDISHFSLTNKDHLHNIGVLVLFHKASACKSTL